MAKAKAKYLEGTTLSLITLLEGIVNNPEAGDKDNAKVPKIVEELKERFNEELAVPSVNGLLAQVCKLTEEIMAITNQVTELYDSEVQAATLPVEEVKDEPAGEDKEDEPKKGKKKKSKKVKEVEPEEDDSEDSEDAAEDDGDDSDVDLEAMTKKELRAYMKELGYKVDKKASKEEMLEMLNK